VGEIVEYIPVHDEEIGRVGAVLVGELLGPIGEYTYEGKMRQDALFCHVISPLFQQYNIDNSENTNTYECAASAVMKISQRFESLDLFTG
jgi:hypothetical protein